MFNVCVCVQNTKQQFIVVCNTILYVCIYCTILITYFTKMFPFCMLFNLELVILQKQVCSHIDFV